MAHLDEARRRQGEPPLPFGVALHLGEFMWGNIGAADRLDFTAIGPAVNLVSRLEGLCRPLGRPVVVSGAFAAETGTTLIPLGTHALRGIAIALRRLHCAEVLSPDGRNSAIGPAETTNRLCFPIFVDCSRVLLCATCAGVRKGQIWQGHYTLCFDAPVSQEHRTGYPRSAGPC